MALKVDISKRLGSFQLHAAFETGREVMGLLGASGCGKSVTLKCIAGLLTPDAGYIELNGRVLFDSAHHINLSPQKRQIGYLFQNYALFPHMTVRQNIAAGFRTGFYAGFRAGTRTETRAYRQARVGELLRLFSLEELANQYPDQLSGGQQQRTALARILASEPEVLLLDEPFTALDSYLKWQVEFELMELLRLFSGPTLFVTHSQTEALHFCRSVCILEQGRTQPKTDMQTILTAPATLAACLLSGCENVSRVQPVDGTRVHCLDWGITLDCGRPLPRQMTHVGIRANRLQWGFPGQPNTFPCSVIRMIPNLYSHTIVLAAPGGREGFACLRMEVEKQAGTNRNSGTAGSVDTVDTVDNRTLPAATDRLLLHFAPESLLCIPSGSE